MPKSTPESISRDELYRKRLQAISADLDELAHDADMVELDHNASEVLGGLIASVSDLVEALTARENWEDTDRLHKARTRWAEDRKLYRERERERRSPALERQRRYREKMKAERLNRNDAAEYLGVAEVTMRKWAQSGKGPKFIRMIGKVWYLKTDLDAFIKECRDWEGEES